MSAEQARRELKLASESRSNPDAMYHLAAAQVQALLAIADELRTISGGTR